MKNWILTLLACTLIPGCVSSQIIPKEGSISFIHKIDVVPVEAMPLLLHPLTEDDREALGAMAVYVPGVGEPSLGWLAQSTHRGHATWFPSDAISSGREVPGEVFVFEKGQPGGMSRPTTEYAKAAVVLLRKGGDREAKVVDRYIELPITNRYITLHMEDWLAPVRRLYNSDVSRVDYAALASSDHVDAILEVGAFTSEYVFDRLLLSVFVRLVDTRTGQVLGRTAAMSIQKEGPLAPLLRDDAAGLKRLVLETGNRLVAQCLGEVRLIAD